MFSLKFVCLLSVIHGLGSLPSPAGLYHTPYQAHPEPYHALPHHPEPYHAPPHHPVEPKLPRKCHTEYIEVVSKACHTEYSKDCHTDTVHKYKTEYTEDCQQLAKKKCRPTTR
eukprot:TRINITY_DN10416_c0_g1_i1.p1 TRINITY_DN10416_c0_g1~~TRINITY_DN10416_c0_g1_i1.p1  ORF type:complete len:113 (-),score=18.37 TRINITY_DN10416_c0_g1_i1:198-536(-)